jgi:hypothetical protein
VYEIEIYKINIPNKCEDEWLPLLMKSQCKKEISPIWTYKAVSFQKKFGKLCKYSWIQEVAQGHISAEIMVNFYFGLIGSCV